MYIRPVSSVEFCMHRIQFTFRFDRNHSAACRTKTQWFTALMHICLAQYGANFKCGKQCLIVKRCFISSKTMKKTNRISVAFFYKFVDRSYLKLDFW